MRVIREEWLRDQFEQLAPQSIRDHSLAVARGCQEFALSEGASEEALFLAGLLHDIGKSSKLHQTGFHPLDGARWLQEEGEIDLAHLVARHSTSPVEAQLLRISLLPWNREAWVLEQAILDAVDLTTDPLGRSVPFRDRYRDIRDRYGEGSVEVLSLERLTSTQKQYIRLREAMI